jgi:hypothetical protein
MGTSSINRLAQRVDHYFEAETAEEIEGREDLSREQKRKLLHQNAARFYGL